jgi:ATP-dependent exoDNAse (exonuclease V) beta subunit
MSENTNLIVYKASAGSGKTFNLVLEYVSLLILNPKAYRSILAVTFTNKATAEMKQRILKELLDISKNNKGNFFNALSKRINGLDDNTISLKAKEALSNILHDYSYFNIQTIDAFLQRVMRSIAKELGIGSNYNLIIDETQLLQKAIERMIEASDSDELLFDWYMGMISSKMDEGKRIDVEKELLEFGRNLDKEKFKMLASDIKLLKKEDWDSFKQRGKKEVELIEKQLKDYGERFILLIEQRGLTPDDFANKQRGIAGALCKIKNEVIDFRDKAYYTKAKDDAQGWFVKQNQSAENLSFANDTLIPLMEEYFRFYDSKIKVLNTWKAVLPFVLRIGLLRDIAKYRDEILREDNKFLLSNTSKLLTDIISLDSSEISFIYEKIGSKLQYIMIDEFQDTSRLNWRTLLPLVTESLDNGYRSVIVGDVKQSIYRWRNGDWTLLNNIHKGLSTNSDITNFRKPEIRFLQDNYRTYGNIVEFNNLLFADCLKVIEDNELLLPSDESLISKQKREVLRSVFSDARQKVREDYKDKGELRCQFLVKEKDISIDENVRLCLAKEIEYFLSKGFAYSDIALLFRSHKELDKVSEYLREINLPLVSEQAFSYQSSESIRLIIEALRYIANKENYVSLSALKLNFLSSKVVFSEDIQRAKTHEVEVDELLWLKNRDNLLNKPLFDLIAFIIKQLKLDQDPNELGFITSFLDKVQEFGNEDGVGDITSFLIYWEEELMDKRIAISDQVEGIRVLTIHKAKGLEYPVVIVPYANWEFYDTRGTKTHLWLENKLSDVPKVCYSNLSSLYNSLYDEDYSNEVLQQYVDNLNLLYVALTRPKYAISVIGHLKMSKEEPNITPIENVSQFIYSALHSHNLLKEGIIPQSSTDQDDNLDNQITNAYHYHVEPLTADKISSNSNLTFSQDNQAELPHTIDNPKQIPISTGFNEAKIRYSQTKQAEDYIKAMLEEKTNILTPRLKGIILHNLLSNIILIDDIQKALDISLAKGEITQENRVFFEALINDMFSLTDAKDWFSEKYKVFNEVDIVVKQGNQITTKRPDRLMITKDNEIILVDYKFAQTKKNIKQYSSQIKTYEQLIKQIGFNKIQSYLWFVNFNESQISSEIVEVK